MRKLFYILFISCFLSHISYGQNQKLIDSLRIALKGNTLTDKQRAIALSQLGWHSSYYDLGEGLKYAEEGYKIAKQNNYLSEMAHAANVIGTIYMDLGNYPQAIDYLQKAISYNEQVNNKISAAISASNLCIIY
ncbi:MAG TPA: tetratricopeptide repeat protein, partial [Bacteroidia bacterium]